MFRPVKIRHYLAAMQERGLSAEAVFDGTGIEESRLREPSYLVDLRQSRAVVANMIRLTGNQGIGFEIGGAAEFADLGIVGYAMLSCRNVRDANQLWIHYHNELIGLMVKESIEEQGSDNWSITLSELVPMGFLFNFCVEESLMMMVKLGGAMADQMPVIERLELSYPAPMHEALYRRHLHPRPEFNAPQTRVQFSAPALDRPLRGRDEEANTVCRQHCSQVLRQLSEKSAIASRLRTLLLSRPSDMPTLDQAAAALGIGARSLRRRLDEEGHSFHQLIGEFRYDLAREYLKSQISIKEVSYALGFKDADSFRRAFKAWSGQTISAYREQIGQEFR